MKDLLPDVPYKKLHFTIQDFASLQQDALKTLENEHWIEHVNQRDYNGEWQVIPLRGLICHRDAHPILQAFQISDHDPEHYINYPIIRKLPGVETLLQQLRCGVLSARLMKLEPGAMIRTHRDQDLCFSKGQVRLHLCLFSNNDVSFTVAGEEIHILEGELWYLNADEPHSVTNNSDTPRIHLVIDCLSNEWLQHLIGIPDSVKLDELHIPQRQAWIASIGQTMLDHESASHDQLRRKPLSFMSGLSDLIGMDMQLTVPANDEFTQTGNGRAISPLSAAKCAAEQLRSARFITGIHQAICDRLETQDNINILYAGTGPFATLLLPLLPLLDANRVSVTFLDIHPFSIDILKQILQLTGLEAFANHFVCANACDWQPEESYDLIISETMKAALVDECQVSIFSNLVNTLKNDGCLIPESVTINAFAVYDNHTTTHLGEVSQLRNETARALCGGSEDALDKTFRLDQNQHLDSVMLETHIQVYGDMALGNYECSLNRPETLQYQHDQPVKTIQLKYETGEKPGYQLLKIN